MDESLPIGNAEGNNTTNLSFVSLLAVYPDLSVGNVTATPGGSWQPGNTVTIGWTTSNSGNRTPVRGWTERVVVRNTLTGGVVFSRDVAVSASEALAPNATADRSLAFTWPGGIDASGIFTISVTTDIQNDILEVRDGVDAEANNSAAISVRSAPDLRLENLAVSGAQSAGGTVTISWDVVNSGSAATPSGWTDRVTIRRVSSGETLATANLAYAGLAVDVNGRITRSLQLRLPDGAAGAGDLRVVVETDIAGSYYYAAVVEENEGNNSATLNFTSSVTSYPDLTVTTVTAPPARAAASRSPCPGQSKIRVAPLHRGTGATALSFRRTGRLAMPTTSCLARSAGRVA